MLSIRRLLAAVAFVAVGCASITYASSEWQLILRFLFCVSVLACILALFYRRGERQAFCAASCCSVCHLQPRAGIWTV